MTERKLKKTCLQYNTILTKLQSNVSIKPCFPQILQSILKPARRSTERDQLTSFNINYENTITQKVKGSINLKLLTRKSLQIMKYLKYLQIFNIYIWKKFFQINHVSNYSGGTSFLQFHTNQTTNRIKLVYFLNCPQFFAFIPDASVIRT